MYHHVTKVTMGVVTYCQVHDIINEKTNDRKRVLLWKGSNMSCYYFFVSTWICWFTFFGHKFYGLVHFACNLWVHRNKKVSLCHLVLWQPIICEFFPKDFSEFLNFKFNLKFALIQYCFFTNSKFVVLVKQRMWNNNNKQNIFLDMQYLHMNSSYCIL
jgi:hypothetical protein